MVEIDALFERLDKDRDVDRIRLDIAGLIAKQLAQARESFGYWEKAHFAQAIAALAWNVNLGNRDTTSWLRLCLVNLELAHVPLAQRSEDYTPRNKQIDALTFDELMADIRKLGGRA